jgi:acyl carrier protein
MSADLVRAGVDAILRDRLRIGAPSPVTDLLDTGLIDSLGLVELIASIEQRFDVVINLMDLDLDHVRTVLAIYDLVERVVATQRSETPPVHLVATVLTAPVAVSDRVA